MRIDPLLAWGGLQLSVCVDCLAAVNLHCGNVRTVISAWLGFLLVVGAVQAPLLHEHASRDHVHPEHQHGIAAHLESHHHDQDEASRVESHAAQWIDACDPGDHVTRVSLFNVTLTEHGLPAADITAAWQFTFSPQSTFRSEVLDVRVHGPPVGCQLSPRPPPSSYPA